MKIPLPTRQLFELFEKIQLTYQFYTTQILTILSESLMFIIIFIEEKTVCLSTPILGKLEVTIIIIALDGKWGLC